MTLPIGVELEAAAWFYLGDVQSRMDAEEMIRIAFNRARWHESVVISHPRLTARLLGDDGVPAPPHGVLLSGLRLLHAEATVIGHAPRRADVLGSPFLSTLTKEDVMLLREITARAHAASGEPPLKPDELDAAIEMLGPDMARTAILQGGA